MVGYLKADAARFCVEYTDQQMQVFWSPIAPQAAARAKRWIEEALPGFEKVPETMLRSLIGGTEFVHSPIRKEKAVEQHGKLSDGGAIKLVYFKNEPLSEDDYHDAVETLTTWIRSYFG